MNIDYDKALNYSYNVACKYLRDRDKAQDIAQLSAIQLFLNCEKIDPDKLDNWLFTVTKNFCFKHFKMSQKNNEVILEPSFLENLNIPDIENISFDLDFYSFEFIKPADQRLLDKYYHEQYTISDLARAYKLKKKRLKNKIYKLSQEIILFQRMNDNVFTDSIPGSKLHIKLQYFLTKFVRALNESNLVEFSKSLTGCIVHDSINNIEIKTIKKITIDFFSEGYYQGIIFYQNFIDEIKVFLFKFILENGNKIKILEFPLLPKLVVSSFIDNVPKELKGNRTFDTNGKLVIDNKLLINLANHDRVKIVQADKFIFKD